jgi:SAM-dependent methyltransferase
MASSNARLFDRVRRQIPERWRLWAHSLLANSASAQRVVKRLLRNDRDMAVILAELSRGERPWHDFAGGALTVGSTERVVELPWVLSRCQGTRALDIGTAFGLPVFVDQLLASVPEVHAVDIALMPVAPQVHLVQADVRRLPYADRSFDLITCVSTLEHIGLDRGSIVHVAREDRGDVVALRDLRRVLAPDGRLLVTVPFGRAERHDLFRQYDLNGWQGLLDESGLVMTAQDVYGYSSANGWRRVVDVGTVADQSYQGNGAIGAGAVLCSELRRAAPP